MCIFEDVGVAVYQGCESRGAGDEEEEGEWDDEGKDLGIKTQSQLESHEIDREPEGERMRRTAEIPTPILTPRPRTSHQRKAPTSPAAPVPEAKYLQVTESVKMLRTENSAAYPTLCPPIEGG